MGGRSQLGVGESFRRDQISPDLRFGRIADGEACSPELYRHNARLAERCRLEFDSVFDEIDVPADLGFTRRGATGIAAHRLRRVQRQLHGAARSLRKPAGSYRTQRDADRRAIGGQARHGHASSGYRRLGRARCVFMTALIQRRLTVERPVTLCNLLPTSYDSDMIARSAAYRHHRPRAGNGRSFVILSWASSGHCISW